MTSQVLWWVGFGVFVFVMLTLDLKVFNRKSHEIKIKEALLWTAFWVALALLFCLGIYLWRGHGHALEFLTCYLIEESLSVDNLFVFLLIFAYFAVAPMYQHKVLYWGIIGAIIMRLIFIVAGIDIAGQIRLGILHLWSIPGHNRRKDGFSEGREDRSGKEPGAQAVPAGLCG